MLKFIGYLFGCSSNQRAIAIYQGGGRTKLAVCDYNGVRLSDYHQPEMNSEDLGQWLADTMGDEIINCSSAQLDAVVGVLKK